MQIVDSLDHLHNALEDASPLVDRLRGRVQRNPVIRHGLQEVRLEFDSLRARVEQLLELAEAD